jgi:hypothetical protein
VVFRQGLQADGILAAKSDSSRFLGKRVEEELLGFQPNVFESWTAQLMAFELIAFAAFVYGTRRDPGPFTFAS